MQFVRVVFADLNGAMKGKLIPKEEFDQTQLFGMPRSMLLQDIEGEETHTIRAFSPESGDTDMKLRPDATTLVAAPGNNDMEQVIADLVNEHGEEFRESPRLLLKNAVAELEAMGLQASVATELEFYVLKSDGSLYDSKELEQPYGDINALDKLGGLLGKLTEGVGAIGLVPEAVLSEAGPGQMEINFQPKYPLEMADRTFYFKQMIREVTRAQGSMASFLAKPFVEHSGSGCHVHLSLWRGEQNVFDAEPHLLESFSAGLAAYAHESYALMAPNPNSYRRVVLSHGYVPDEPSWGNDDRRVALRFVGEGQSRRVEHRISGADVNPYLLLASILRAGLKGIKNQLRFDSEVVIEARSKKFADSLPQAINDLKDSDFARLVFSPEFVEAFSAVKLAEWQKFQAQITDWEKTTYGTQV